MADLSAYYKKARLGADRFYGNSIEELTVDGKVWGVPQGWGIEFGTGLTTLMPLLWAFGGDLLDKDKKKASSPSPPPPCRPCSGGQT